jgi:hypothetical protein
LLTDFTSKATPGANNTSFSVGYVESPEMSRPLRPFTRKIIRISSLPVFENPSATVLALELLKKRFGAYRRPFESALSNSASRLIGQCSPLQVTPRNGFKGASARANALPFGPNPRPSCNGRLKDSGESVKRRILSTCEADSGWMVLRAIRFARFARAYQYRSFVPRASSPR